MTLQQSFGIHCNFLLQSPLQATLIHLLETATYLLANHKSRRTVDSPSLICIKLNSQMSRLFILVLFVVCVCRSSYAFTLTMKTSQPSLQQSMIKKFSGIACATCIMISSVSGIAGPAFAAVGEGDLPDGAMAFQKLLKYQVLVSHLIL